MMRVGLVLEGGAMRGMYTAGVLDVFLEHGIRADCIVGVSAGALFGVNFLSGQKGRVIRYNKRFNSDKNYMGLRPLLREGNIVSTKYAYEDVPRRLDPFDDAAYKKSGVPFYAVVTNLETGLPEYIKIDSVFARMDALRASGSMPFVSRPVIIDGKPYLDGGISDSIPFRFAESLGCEKRIVILTRDMEYRKKPMSPALIRLWFGKSPMAEKLLHRHALYHHTIEELKELEAAGESPCHPSLKSHTNWADGEKSRYTPVRLRPWRERRTRKPYRRSEISMRRKMNTGIRLCSIVVSLFRFLRRKYP